MQSKIYKINNLISKGETSKALEEIAQLNENEINTRTSGYEQSSLLETACIHANVEIVKALLEKNVNIDSKNPNQGYFALHLLVEGQPKALPIYAMTLADLENRKKILALFKEKNCNFNVVDGTGRNAIICATVKNQFELIPLLKANGTDINQKDREQDTFYDYIINKYSIKPHQPCKKDNLLLAYLKNLDAHSGHQAIQFSSSENEYKDYSYLLNHKDPMGRTPIHDCAFQGDLEALSLYLSLFKDSHTTVNVADNEGNTPLHLALTQKRESNIISLLLQKGADPKIKNREKLSPIDIASKNEMLDYYLKDLTLKTILTEKHPQLIEKLTQKSKDHVDSEEESKTVVTSTQHTSLFLPKSNLKLLQLRTLSNAIKKNQSAVFNTTIKKADADILSQLETEYLNLNMPQAFKDKINERKEQLDTSKINVANQS